MAHLVDYPEDAASLLEYWSQYIGKQVEVQKIGAEVSPKYLDWRPAMLIEVASRDADGRPMAHVGIADLPAGAYWVGLSQLRLPAAGVEAQLAATTQRRLQEEAAPAAEEEDDGDGDADEDAASSAGGGGAGRRRKAWLV